MLLKVVSAWLFFNTVVFINLNMAVNFVSGKHFLVTTIFGYALS